MTPRTKAKAKATGKTEEPLFKYDGSQKFNGIPARDLTKADVLRLSINSRRDLLASPAYTGPDVLPDPDPPVVPDESAEGADTNGDAGNSEGQS